MSVDDDIELVKGKGCVKCANTGYYGRIAIAEIMEISKKEKELIIAGASEDELEKNAKDNGMKSIEENMKRAVLEKETSIDEYIKFIKYKDAEV